jgi:hypothetical protein
MALRRDVGLRLFRRVAAILVVALLPTVAIVVPSAVGGLLAFAAPPALAAPHGPAGAVQPNLLWAGYGAVGGSYHDVRAVWQVPAMPKTKSASFAFFWVGLGGDNYAPKLKNLVFGTGLEQIGIEAEEIQGKTAYWPFWEVIPGTFLNLPLGHPQSTRPHFFLNSKGNHLSVEAGDFITASVSMTNGTYYMKMSDGRGTNNTIWTTPTVPVSGSRLDNNSAEVIMEDPAPDKGQREPLADFGRVVFDGASVDGEPIGSTNPTKFTLNPNPGVVVSPIGANGDNFTITTPAPAKAPAPRPQVPTITSVGTYTQGELVYFDIHYADPGHDAEGFGFVGINGSGWAEETHPFSSPSYGIVGPDSIAYPFNEACGTAQQYDSYVEAWIYDTAGQRSTPVVIHLVCAGSGGSAG